MNFRLWMAPNISNIFWADAAFGLDQLGKVYSSSTGVVPSGLGKLSSTAASVRGLGTMDRNGGEIANPKAPPVLGSTENEPTKSPFGVYSTSSLGWAGFTLTASLLATIRFPFGARTRPIGPCRLAGSWTMQFASPLVVQRTPGGGDGVDRVVELRGDVQRVGIRVVGQTARPGHKPGRGDAMREAGADLDRTRDLDRLWSWYS